MSFRSTFCEVAIMATSHKFGGDWTEEKLESIRRYLVEYVTIFTRNIAAQNLTTIYVDAFAGTGAKSPVKETTTSASPLFQGTDTSDHEAEAIRKGSARIALELEPGFDKYIFIEKRQGFTQELEVLRASFPEKEQRIEIVHGDANERLQNWCRATNWRTHRAVVFLDPYGMEVKWETIKALANTRAVDLWILFPLGQAVNRLLTRNGPPDGLWADKLTAIFGTTAWREEFYRPRMQMSFLDDGDVLEKDADFDKIGGYFVQRLQEVFAKVAEKPRPLRNSKNTPIFLLCFASANPKGAPIAVRIAQHILTMP